MSQQIVLYSHALSGRAPTSTGQYGQVQTNAVRIDVSSRCVTLKAITLAPGAASCQIGLPNDPGTLRELAAVLLMAGENW